MRRVCLVVMALLLAACGNRIPAPVEERSTEPPRPMQTQDDGQYLVQRGDSLWMIAFHFGLDHRELARWNDIGPPFVIHPGDALRLTPPPRAATTRPAGPPPSARTQTPQAPSPEAQAPIPKPTPRAATNPPQQQIEAPTRQQSVPANGPLAWQQPAKGRLLRGFVANNPSRNGWDITAEPGAPIVAAAAGEVVYSGSGLIGYGELIIIKHNDKILSAYAHNRARLVSEGDAVTAGQVIGEMGRNDRNEVVLHFEIRENGKPVDPGKYVSMD